MSEWFAIIAQSPDPRGRIRRMGDGHLSAAIAEIEGIPEPNRWQAEVYAEMVAEVLLRWRTCAGLGPGRSV